MKEQILVPQRTLSLKPIETHKPVNIKSLTKKMFLKSPTVHVPVVWILLEEQVILNQTCYRLSLLSYDETDV